MIDDLQTKANVTIYATIDQNEHDRMADLALQAIIDTAFDGEKALRSPLALEAATYLLNSLNVWSPVTGRLEVNDAPKSDSQEHQDMLNPPSFEVGRTDIGEGSARTGTES